MKDEYNSRRILFILLDISCVVLIIVVAGLIGYNKYYYENIHNPIVEANIELGIEDENYNTLYSIPMMIKYKVYDLKYLGLFIVFAFGILFALQDYAYKKQYERGYKSLKQIIKEGRPKDDRDDTY